MCLLFSLMIMLILAEGSCKEYIEVETTEGGNASLPFTTFGLTIFCEIDCEKRTRITKIGQYCGPDENCTTNLSTPFSIETGNLIVRNVTSNRCFSAELIQGTGHSKTFHNVSINKLLNSTISTETPTTTFTTETDDYTSTDSSNNTALFSVPRDVVVVVVVFVVVVVAAAAAVAVVVILVTLVLLAVK
ncbi:hypothetical protein G5714_022330 [Onychostoma macrolepis]|uniref:Uncharacterized protein n=1 Tax=Onychostoma macrolepis TaxID=369639 RepID=A0A7J6BNU2_9TELE|nr:hypothetical protein G5714_022330 [Onychostoma macrolepis]